MKDSNDELNKTNRPMVTVPVQLIDDLIDDMEKFLNHFEKTFDGDWQATLSILRSDDIDRYIGARGSFLDPICDGDEPAKDWPNRVALHRAYNHLRVLICDVDGIKHGIFETWTRPTSD